MQEGLFLNNVALFPQKRGVEFITAREQRSELMEPLWTLIHVTR